MNNTLDQQSPAVYSVDTEHGGLRISIVFIFVVAWAVVFAVLNSLLTSEGLNIIAMIVSFAITAVLTQQIERNLKRRWPSGRTVQVENDHIRMMKKDKVEQEINTSQQVNVLLWRFKISRRARVPKGWFMVACALEQDDIYIPIYTFMSPADFEALDASYHFPLLQSKKELEREGRENMRLAGEQRRLHTAEQIRWMDGAEMSAEDFKQFIRRLQERFPQWMPSVI
ncbi:MAG: hypothetical protein CL610_03765 [Anaerolineaceae bacterium]|nr:hypothetical protein [Anaerolineaceae bacterium]